MQGKWLTMEEQLEHLNAFLMFFQFSLQSAPGVLDKEKAISALTGSLIAAYCL
jgi:hypothetical protein